MCGILGVYVNNPKKVCEDLYEIFLNQKNRGTEGFGLVIKRGTKIKRIRTENDNLFNPRHFKTWSKLKKNDIVLYHHRYPTSTSNESKFNHPISNEDGSMFLIHNGVLSNDSEIKKELEARGHKFETEDKEKYSFTTSNGTKYFSNRKKFTDSEVLVHLLEEDGNPIKSLKDVNGSVAIAWVNRKGGQKIHLYCNRKNPLSVFTKNGNMYFASVYDEDLRELKFKLKHDFKFEYGVVDKNGYKQVEEVKFKPSYLQPIKVIEPKKVVKGVGYEVRGLDGVCYSKSGFKKVLKGIDRKWEDVLDYCYYVKKLEDGKQVDIVYGKVLEEEEESKKMDLAPTKKKKKICFMCGVTYEKNDNEECELCETTLRDYCDVW